MDLLAAGAAYLAQTRKAFAASLVTYARGDASAEIKATKGRSEFDVSDSQGFMRRVETTDFIVNTADLVVSEALTLPRAGDSITDADGAAYEVRAPGPGADHWRYTDAHRLELRIHT